MSAESPIIDISSNSRVVIGAGVVKRLADVIPSENLRKCLIVTDKYLVKTGHLDVVIDALKAVPIAVTVYDDVEPDPNTQLVQQGVDQFHKNNCDCLVAVGGGSSIDTAKAIGVLVSNGGSIIDYEGVGKVKKPLPFLVVIPTLYGSGSEVTSGTVVTDEERNFKAAILSPYIVPQLALVDPKMMVGAPRKLAGAVGLDALSHAAESYVSRHATPISEALALRAIELIAKHFSSVLENRDNEEALLGMATASTMAGMAFSMSRLGLVHAFAHPLGSFYHLPHGVTCAVMLPHVMAFNQSYASQKYDCMAKVFAQAQQAISSGDEMKNASQYVADMVALADIPLNIGDLGAKKSDIPAIVDQAQLSGNVLANPRPTERDELESFLTSCF